MSYIIWHFGRVVKRNIMRFGKIFYKGLDKAK